MEASEGRFGRVFVLRLAEGERLAEVIERFAAEKGILTAQVFVLAGAAQAGIIAPDSGGVPRLRLPGAAAGEGAVGPDCEVVMQEVLGIHFQRVRDPESGRETLAKAPLHQTRVMDRPAPAPSESGPGTMPVYVFNADFN